MHKKLPYSCDFQLQSICPCARAGCRTTEFQNTHGRATAGHLSAIKVGFRAVVMWSWSPSVFKAFTPVSPMNYRTLGPSPGRPLICLHFYSSHQFAEATLTNIELMAEHLRFKTFPTSPRCLYEKNQHAHCNILNSTDQFEMKCKSTSGEVRGKGLALAETLCEHRFLQKYTVKTQFKKKIGHRHHFTFPFNQPESQSCPQSHTRFPCILFESWSSANLRNSTGISTLNSVFFCFAWAAALNRNRGAKSGTKS